MYETFTEEERQYAAQEMTAAKRHEAAIDFIEASKSLPALYMLATLMDTFQASPNEIGEWIAIWMDRQ